MAGGTAGAAVREAPAAAAGDGDLAWRVLRLVREYGEAWARHGAPGAPHGTARGTERGAAPGAFPVRVQSEADLGAARFGLLAWEDPRLAEGAAAPFWRQAGMPEGAIDHGAPALAAMREEGASVGGLRLLGGDLVVRVAHAGAAVQVRLRDVPAFPAGAGISVSHPFGLRMPHAMRRMADFWNVAGRAGPRDGRVRRERGRGSRGC